MGYSALKMIWVHSLGHTQIIWVHSLGHTHIIWVHSYIFEYTTWGCSFSFECTQEDEYTPVYLSVLMQVLSTLGTKLVYLKYSECTQESAPY